MIISLLYHDVVAPGQFDSSGFPGADADIYKLERSQFERHLEAIGRSSCHLAVGIAQKKPDLAASALWFTFDDGGASALSTADLLETRGWRGHFFVTTEYIGKPGFLAAEQIRELYARGHVVGSHSHSHPSRMSQCSQAQLQFEWTESLSILSNLLRTEIRVASVPGGYYSKAVAIAAAAAGVELLFNSEPTPRIQLIDDCLVLGRYSIQQNVSAETATRIACGEWLPRTRQYLFWNLKKVAKRLGGSHYVALRKSILRAAR